jgi:hypothetical protein
MHISRRKLKKSRCRRAGEDQAAGVTVELARAVRLGGVSRSADGYNIKTQSLALKAPPLMNKINAMTLANRPMSDKHLQ